MNWNSLTTILALSQLFSLLVIFVLTVLLFRSRKGQKDSDSFVALRTQMESLPEILEYRFSSQLSRSEGRSQENFGHLREAVLERLSKFHQDFKKDLTQDFESLRKTLNEGIEKLSTKVQENLDEGLKKTNQTFQNVIERLAKIDEAQKKIESLSHNVLSLQDVLTDKKARGVFGEVQLNQILSSVFGERNHSVFQLQYTLSNQKVVDAALFLPEPIGTLCVDSKFPLENYKRMVDRSLSEEERKETSREFVKNVKKHIDDISHKYILAGETANQAILFLPAEAIFAEIHAYHPELIDYANQNRVWITSPTTFLATLTTVQMILLNVERNKYMHVMHEEINKLGEEFERYQDRWDKLAKHIETVTKDVHQIQTTTDKISKRFHRIKEVDFEEQEKNSEASQLKGVEELDPLGIHKTESDSS